MQMRQELKYQSVFGDNGIDDDFDDELIRVKLFRNWPAWNVKQKGWKRLVSA